VKALSDSRETFAAAVREQGVHLGVNLVELGLGLGHFLELSRG